MPSKAMFASKGDTSPPTKWQTFFFGIIITRIRVDPKHDMDCVTRHFYPLDQRSDEGAFARPVGHLHPVVQLGGTVLQPANNELQCPLQGRLRGQRLALLFQPGETLTQASAPGLKLSLVAEALRITVDQPGHALASLAALVLDGGQRRAVGARLGLPAPSVFLREPRRVGHQGTDFLPHRQVQQVGPHLRLLAEARAAKALGLRPQTALIGRGARVAFAGARTEACAIAGRAPGLALEQALQPRQGAPARAGPGAGSPATAPGRPRTPRAPRALGPGAGSRPPEAPHGRRRHGAAARAGGAGPAAGAAAAPGGSGQTPPPLARPDASRGPTRHGAPRRLCRCASAPRPGAGGDKPRPS